MSRFFTFLFLCFIASLPAFAQEGEMAEEVTPRSSPSPYGDTQMGGDAAATGTNVEDGDVQAQEDDSGMSVDEQSESPYEDEDEAQRQDTINSETN